MKYGTCLHSYVVIFLLMLAPDLWAAPNSLTYQGRIVKADGTALEYNNVSFLFEITNSNGSCVIYREQKNGINMANSHGVFDVPIGTGTKLFPSSATKTLLNAFDNTLTHDCADTDNNVSGTYTPSVTHGRLLRVQFHDGSGWKLISPDNEIRTVPYSAFAHSAEKLGDKSASDFMLRTGIPTCTASEFLKWNGSALICAPVTGASGGTVTSVSSTSPYLTVADATSAPQLTLNIGTTSGTIAAGDDGRFTDARIPKGSASGDLSGTYPNPSVIKLQNIAVSNAIPTLGHYFKYDGTQWVNAPVDISDVTNLNSTLNTYLLKSTFNGYVTSAGCLPHQTMYWSAMLGFQCQAINVSVAGDVSGSIGAVSVNKIKGLDVDTTGLAPGQVLKYDGTKWAPANDNNAGGTVTNIATGTGLSGGPITSTGTISLANTTVVAGSYTRANITVDAQGRLTSATNGSAVNLASDVTGVLPLANGGTGQTSALAAFNTLSPLTTKGDILVRDATNNIRLPVGTDGQMLSANSSLASGLEWITPKNGTVTNVTGADPIAVSNGTTTPVISINDATTTSKGAVQVGAGISVSSGTISADPSNFPSSVPVSKGGTGATTLTPNRLIASNGTGSALTTFNCAVGQLTTFDATGMMICSSFTTGSVFLNGGNSFTAAANLGTNDAYALNLKTTNVTRMTLHKDGYVGIGQAPDTTAALAIMAPTANKTPLVLNSPTNGKSEIDFLRTGSPWLGTIGFSDGSTTELFITNGTNAPIIFDTNNDEKVRIQADGKVGIGSSGPGALLQVGGWDAQATYNSIFVGSYHNTNGQAQFVGNWNSTGYWGMGPAANPANGVVRIGNANPLGDWRSTQDLSLQVPGRIGLGPTATAPERVIHIKGTGGVDDDIYVQSQGNTAESALILTRARDASGAASPVLTNDSLGFLVFRGYDGSNYISSAQIQGIAASDYATSKSAVMAFSNVVAGAWGERMRIHSDGSVGIGTASPLTKLDVAGGIRSSSNITNGGFDFMLGNSDQVSRGNSGGSRALVKDSGSVLVINYGGDFTGGTAVNGPVFRPYADNGATLGTGAQRWSAVYSSNGTIQTSDRRLKSHITNLDQGLAFIQSLRPVSYKWTREENQPLSKTHWGFIAQELDDSVHSAKVGLLYKDDASYWGVNYSELIAPLTKAVQELHGICKASDTQLQEISRKIENHDRRIASLENENANLKKKNQDLEKQIQKQAQDLELIKNQLGIK